MSIGDRAYRELMTASTGGAAENLAHDHDRHWQLRPRGERVPATDGERRALASVLRLRILRLCLYEPLTNKEIADRLGRDPATVLHHVRTLVTHGFLVAGEVRPGPRGSREVPYAATGKSWALDFDEPAGAGPATGAGRPSLINTMLRAFFEEITEVPQESIQTTRIGMQLSDEHRQELADKIAGVLDEVVARGPDPDGARWSLFLAMHPEPGPR